MIAGIPALLQDRAVAPLVRTYFTEAFANFPIQRVFDEPGKELVISQEEFEYEIVTMLRELANLQATPAHAEERALFDIKKRYGRVFYMAEGVSLKSNDLAAFKDPGSQRGIDYDVADSRARIRRFFSTNLRAILQKFGRTVERRCAQIFSTGSFTYDLSGSTETMDYGLTVTNTGGDWATPTFNILADFFDMVVQFSRNAGGLPTKILTDIGLWPTYVGTNNTFVDYDQRNIMLTMQRFLERAAGIPEGKGPEWIMSTAQHGAKGAETPIFPTNRLTMIRDVDDPNHFRMKTARTLDNNMQGGAFGRTHEILKAPAHIKVEATYNGIPHLGDTTKVMIWDVTASQ